MSKNVNFANNGISILNSNKELNTINLVNPLTKMQMHNSLQMSLPLGLPEIPDFNNLLSGQVTTTITKKEKTFKEIVDSIPASQRNKYLSTLKKTDDFLFAQNEVNAIDSKIERSKFKSLKIWDKKTHRGSYSESEEKEVNIRKKILEIKKNVKEKGGLAHLNLKNQKYFSKNHLDLIYESTRIIQEKSAQNSNLVLPGKTDSLYNFIIDNREISMKNFILDLLKSERTKILTKEGEVSKALKDSEVKMEDDYRRFENFTEYERNKQKEMDKILLEAAKDNRDLADKKKKLNQENKQIMDELERTVKAIRNFKGDAIFVHFVLGDLKSIKFRNDMNVLDKKNFEYNEISQKDSDYEKITEDLMYVLLIKFFYFFYKLIFSP
jgi:hypothetical protein